MWFKGGEAGRCWVGRLPFRGDLLLSIEDFARRENIRAARVEVIGAVERAVVAFYDQQAREYITLKFEESLEILSCIGNLSMREGKPRAHMHITFGSREEQLKGGHLREGTVVFAGEFFVQEIIGPELVREHDEDTGLPLWNKY